MTFKRMSLLVLLIAAMVAGIWYYGVEREESPIIIASKDFTESILVSEIYAQALEAEGFKVERKQALGGTAVIHAAMLAGEVNFYPEYTSTALVTVLKEVPEFNTHESYTRVKSAYKEKFNFTLLNMTNVSNSQGMAITKKAADKYKVRTLTDLSKAAPHLRLAATPEFEERTDGLAGLKRSLGGFNFASVKVFDKGIKYEVLRKGEADVNVCFTTDANLSKGDIVAIEDDISFWPPYILVPVIRSELLKRDPDIEEVVNSVSSLLDSSTMRALNAQVDIDKREYKEVAASFLADKGSTN